ncbi:hypothetical protein OHR68_09780 [Spirillospora sp. NBC_00431]
MTPAEELRAAARLMRGEPAPEPHPVRLPPKMPDVYAEPLAVHLDAVADFAATTYGSTFPEHDTGGQCADPVCRLVYAAVTTARAITGST